MAATINQQPKRNSPVRWVLLALLLTIVLGVAVDMHRFAGDGTAITALRTQPVGTAEEGSVDAFCGFAPCGMPLECN
jgi:hypothetical protein